MRKFDPKVYGNSAGLRRGFVELYGNERQTNKQMNSFQATGATELVQTTVLFMRADLNVYFPLEFLICQPHSSNNKGNFPEGSSMKV